MSEASRTKRTLQNSRMSLLLFLVQIFVGFYSRKIFLDYLGAEVLGLNTTLGNILSFMNLAELGIGIAMATSLYKPIHEKDQETICEIITVQGWLYRRVALLILVAGVAVMALLPFIFPNTECGLAYVYSSFAVFLFGTLTSYWWNYRQVLISADQKNYRLQPWMHAVRYAVMGLQIFFLCVVDWGIWGWLFWTFVGNVVTVFVINAVLKKEYPWLHKSRKKGRDLLNKYHHLIVMTKQLFVHKLATFVLEQTTPLIIYAYVSLSMVTHYANYMIIVGYVATSVGVVFAGMSASIGSLVAENNKQHTLEVFWELLSSRLWIAALACYAIYLFVSPFICLWIGSSYLLDEQTLLLILVGAFIRLLGSNLSLVLIVLLWKPYYLFRHGFKTSSAQYYTQYVWLILILVLCAEGCNLLIPKASKNNLTQMLRLFPIFIAYASLTYIFLYATSKGMRRFTVRIINLIKH